MKNLIAGILLTIIVIIVAGLIYILSGAYNVSQLSPHGPIAKWIIEKTMTNSIEKRIKKIEAPDLTDSAKIITGFRHYDEMCAICHLSPGMKESDIAKGLYPDPPEFTRNENIPEAEEGFWIVQNGIKMTGMPAFSPTHNDDEIWAMISFLINKMPGLTESDYNSMKKSGTKEY
jgi:mono/diheme cytochrome c family protein